MLKAFPSSSPQPTETLDLSIVICTHNRVRVLLERALTSLAQQHLNPGRKYEILVIDNASSDDTQVRVGNFAAQNPGLPIRLIFEEKVGLSQARNHGVSEARGAVIAFLDDDAAAVPDWVEVLLDAYRRHPEAWAVGGRTIPVCEGTSPGWFKGHMLGYVGGHDYGTAEFQLAPRQGLQGANISFSRQTFEQMDGFRTELGRSGKGMLSHEEGELVRRLHRADRPMYYVPTALVYHYQTSDRFRFENLARTCFNNGVSESLVDFMNFTPPAILRRMLQKVVAIAAAALLSPAYLLVGNTAEAYFWFLRSLNNIGYISTCISQTLSGRVLSKHGSTNPPV